ncbi:MAG: acetate kinase [Oscillospiraceae bacterium]|nr:MAG: acetate kinase [Oscillospiraceae bacterium]
MNVLVVNAGSSSLKYQLFDTTAGVVRAKGLCERIGIDGKIKHQNLETGAVYEKEIAMPNHTVATKIVIDALLSAEYGSVKSMDEIEAVGHRIVHGGAYFSESVLLTDEVLAKLELCRDLAPLHTGAHIMGIQGCLAAMPKTPQVLVFDTAFHTASMPDYAYVYPVSYDMYEKYAVRRYGAHGTSHRYVSGECIKLLGGKAEGTKIVTCHLGNGSSISAVKDGKVLDTSMGFTPLAGIEMGTRCGDIDPAIVPYIMNKTGMNADEMNEYMNKKCGFLGVSGVSSDCRDVSAAAKAGNKRAKLALDIVSYQIRKFIGAYTAAMGGLDAIVFTAGIGENDWEMRESVCSQLGYFGVEFDAEHNANLPRPLTATEISKPTSKVKVFMIPTNEELVIASDTERIVKAL